MRCDSIFLCGKCMSHIYSNGGFCLFLYIYEQYNYVCYVLPSIRLSICGLYVCNIVAFQQSTLGVWVCCIVRICDFCGCVWPLCIVYRVNKNSWFCCRFSARMFIPRYASVGYFCLYLYSCVHADEYGWRLWTETMCSRQDETHGRAAIQKCSAFLFLATDIRNACVWAQDFLLIREVIKCNRMVYYYCVTEN